MTSFHVICGLGLPQPKILGTPMNWKSPEKNFLRPFFFGEHLRRCPWPRAFLSFTSRGSVLGKAVLGLGHGFFLCPWPRAMCPRLHLCSFQYRYVKSSAIYKISRFSNLERVGCQFENITIF